MEVCRTRLCSRNSLNTKRTAGIRNRETETFAAATCAQDEGIDPTQTSIPIDPGTTAVAGVNGRVSLYVHHGTVPFRLSSHRAHDSLGDGVIQSLGRSDRQHSLSKPHAELPGQRKKRKRLSSISIKARSLSAGTDQPGFVSSLPVGEAGVVSDEFHSSRRQDDSDPLCTSHHVIVGNKVSIRRNDHARTNRPLSLDHLAAGIVRARPMTTDFDLDLDHRKHGARSATSSSPWL